MAEHIQTIGDQSQTSGRREGWTQPKNTHEKELAEWRPSKSPVHRVQGELGEIGLMHAVPVGRAESRHAELDDSMGRCGDPVG